MIRFPLPSSRFPPPASPLPPPASTNHRQMQAVFLRRLNCLFVAGIGVPCDASPGIVGQYPFQPDAHLGRSVGDNHLTRVQGIADADATTVMKRNPRSAAGNVEHGVEYWPVGHRVGAVAHALCLTKWRRDTAGVEVVAPNCNRSRDLARS